MADTCSVLTHMDNGVQFESGSSNDVLGHLGPEWRLLHSVGLTDDRGDSDHLLIGPPGAVALTARRRPGATVWVGARSVTVDGQHTTILHNARSHAERSTGLLTVASGRKVAVTPGVVFADLAGFNLQHMPADVHVTTDRRLRGWLVSLPVRLEADEIEAIAVASARISR
jgi:hypothetical protein